MSKDTTDNTRELLRQFLFDYNMNTTAMGMDEEKALRGFLDSVMYLISHREKLLLDRLESKTEFLPKMTYYDGDMKVQTKAVPLEELQILRKELDREEPTHE